MSYRKKKDLRQVHQQRSPHAQRIDEAKKARRAPSHEAWLQQPSKYDIAGIDLPGEWRSKYEQKELAETERKIRVVKKELKERKYATTGKPITDEHMKWKRNELRMYQKTLRKLEWQRKHPFIDAGYDGKGKRNYEWAVENKIDYGFDLRRPQQSFIETYHLKKHDIVGLRIFLEPSKTMELPWEKEKHREMGLKTRAYYKGDRLVLPPTEGEKTEATHDVIQHEVGHHVMHRSKDLEWRWDTDPLRVKKIMREKEAPYRVLGVQDIEQAPWQIAVEARDFFFFSEPFDLFDYKMSALISGGTASYKLLSAEAWALGFASYRSGDFKRRLKKDKTTRDASLERLGEEEKNFKAFRGDKRSSEYYRLKKYYKITKIDFEVKDAVYENRLKFYNWMRKQDAKGWLIK